LSLAISVIAFGGGVWILVESVEGLVGTLTAWAAAAGLSGLALSALVLGIDLEATAAGIAAALRGLPGTALGASVGAAIFLVTIGVGLAALVFPFSVRTPRPVLAAAALATALAVALALDGHLTRVDGALLLAGFAALVGLLLSSRRGAGVPEPSGRRPSRLALRLLAGLAGLVVGAELLVAGTRGVVDELDLSETLFGLLAVGAAVSFEEVVLELLPAYRGQPEISVGNALGTLVFLVTGSLGVIALVHPLTVPRAVSHYHLPALAAAVLLLLALLLRGQMGRVEGAVLVAAYVAYAAGAVLVA
jgi:cation:H+ antiporter